MNDLSQTVVSNQTLDEELGAPQNYSQAPEFRPEVAPLAPDELGAIRYEHNYLSAENRRWPHQDRFMGKENEARRLVNFMHPHEFMRRLQKAGVDARLDPGSFEVWMPDDKTGKPVLVRKERSVGRLWLHDQAVEGRVGISAWVNGKREFITTLQYPYGPEWSLLFFDEFDVPITERYRGWRTALLHLIEKRVITEQEADKAFGPPALGPVSLNYREHLFTVRQQKAGLLAHA